MSEFEPISRVTRSKAEARASYDRLSRWYDLLAGSSERKFRMAGLHLLAAQPKEVILEIGIGTGHSLLTLAQAVGESGCVCGLDLSPGMLQISQTRLCQSAALLQPDLLCADGANLPFAAASFDAVFMSFTLELFDTPELPKVLHGIHHLLRPMGRLVVVSLARVEPPNLANQLYEWTHQKFPSLVDCRPIPVEPLLKAAGFTPTIIQSDSMWGLPVIIAKATLTVKN